jgi:hypothetical protein
MDIHFRQLDLQKIHIAESFSALAERLLQYNICFRQLDESIIQLPLTQRQCVLCLSHFPLIQTYYSGIFKVIPESKSNTVTQKKTKYMTIS